ncbi:MAG: hypothetical protein KGI47_10065 [Betaproteobacteria bacterium]|nr:hypothetical protein [Betaproteobacteria bacterium]
MNLLQLVNASMQECGASGSALTTTANQTGEAARFVSWVQQAWIDIQSLHQDWGFLRTSCAFPLVGGQDYYPVTQTNATNFGQWDRDTFRNYANPEVSFTIGSPGLVQVQGQPHGLAVGDTATFFTDGTLPTGLVAGTPYYVQSVVDADNVTVSATKGGAAINFTGTSSGTQTMTSSNVLTFAGLRSEIFMDEIGYDRWRDLYLYGNLRFTQTRPMEIAVNPTNKALCPGPIAASGWTVVGDYFQAPIPLVNDTDIPGVDTQYQYVIVYKAMERYARYEEDDNLLMIAQREKGMLLQRMRRNYLPKMRMGSALA